MTLYDGRVRHFSLKTEGQINLNGLLRQTTYCNHLMSYIKILENISDVLPVVYRQELTGEFW